MAEQAQPTPTRGALVIVHPTLAAMRDVYALSREGGASSARFAAYRAIVPHGWGLSQYNPMAGEHAAETVAALLALDAEALARAAAHEVADVLGYRGAVELAVVVSSQGMWTDRLATEVAHRTFGERVPGRGLVTLWTREAISAADIEREAAAETVRVAWTALHGPATTLRAVVAREGFAYGSLVEPTSTDIENPASVESAIAILGDSTDPGDAAAVLYGDSVAEAMGWQLVGVADRAGFRWAAVAAAAAIRRDGAPDAFRAGIRALWP